MTFTEALWLAVAFWVMVVGALLTICGLGYFFWTVFRDLWVRRAS